MGEILHNWRILAATLFASSLVVGAYVFAIGTLSAPVAQASTETAILQAIATKDSDSDGLPDWEEALYGTDPHKADTRGLGMTDGEAVAKGLIVPKAAELQVSTSTPGTTPDQLIDGVAPPADGTLTDAFSKNFFTLYLEAKQQKGGDLTEQETSEVAAKALSGLKDAIKPAPAFKTLTDLRISGSGPDAMRAFAVAAEKILLTVKNDSSKSEVLYLKDLVDNNDSSAANHILSIARSYNDAAVGFAQLSVPKELADADLQLINALMRTSEIATDFAKVSTDPLTTMLALQQYPDAVLNLGGAFISVDSIYKKTGLVFNSDTPGAGFVNLISDVANSQKSSTKTP